MVRAAGRRWHGRASLLYRTYRHDARGCVTGDAELRITEHMSPTEQALAGELGFVCPIVDGECGRPIARQLRTRSARSAGSGAPTRQLRQGIGRVGAAPRAELDELRDVHP